MAVVALPTIARNGKKQLEIIKTMFINLIVAILAFAAWFWIWNNSEKATKKVNWFLVWILHIWLAGTWVMNLFAFLC